MVAAGQFESEPPPSFYAFQVTYSNDTLYWYSGPRAVLEKALNINFFRIAAEVSCALFL